MIGKKKPTETTDTETQHQTHTEDKPAATKPCPDCTGQGINVAIDEHKLCQTCEGSGLVVQ